MDHKTIILIKLKNNKVGKIINYLIHNPNL